MEKKITIPSISDYSSRCEWQDAIWQRIVTSEELLSILLTFHEREDIVMRAAARDGLMRGKGQRQLSRELSLSLQTINAVKKAMAENNYKSYSERSKKERKKKQYSPSVLFPEPKPTKRIRTKYGSIYTSY